MGMGMEWDRGWIGFGDPGGVGFVCYRVGEGRIILPISIPPPQQPNHRTGNDVGRVMPVIHGSRDCDEGRAGKGGEEEP